MGYQVYYQLKNKQGDLVSESIGKETNKLVNEVGKQLTWADYLEMEVNSQSDDVMLFITIQTEQHGITKGTPIATGTVNLSESLYTVIKDSKGNYMTKLNIKLEETEGGSPSDFVLKMKY